MKSRLRISLINLILYSNTGGARKGKEYPACLVSSASRTTGVDCIHGAQAGVSDCVVPSSQLLDSHGAESGSSR
jgi:hypothetical protein